MTESFSHKDILDFWFAKENKPKWFIADNEFDQLIKDNFSNIHKKASNGKLSSWRNSPETILALIIILDQFSRNMFRGSHLSFANDKKALEYTKEALSKEFDKQLANDDLRHFLYMPLMHSENMDDQILSVKLFSFLPHILPYAQQHMEVIQRFGRFPTRNKALNRKSTPEETRFLQKAN
ncbi:MAG: DUF924 domain-containing protein [Rickettsiales bacterium]|jgi:uncharacterized protein (DUF924 family)|nr:DUF924 domain-containing protein [Rickettsiales bacterium]